MIANYEVLKDTLFGRLLGCALPQVLKDRLARNESTEIDMSSLDISITVNDVDIDLNKLFSVFERSLQEQPLGSVSAGSASDPDLVNELTQLLEELGSVESSVSEACTDAIGAASSSYYCGEYASDSANESGHEYHPGDEFLYQQISQLRSIIERLEGSQDSSRMAS